MSCSVHYWKVPITSGKPKKKKKMQGRTLNYRNWHLISHCQSVIAAAFKSKWNKSFNTGNTWPNFQYHESMYIPWVIANVLVNVLALSPIIQITEKQKYKLHIYGKKITETQKYKYQKNRNTQRLMLNQVESCVKFYITGGFLIINALLDCRWTFKLQVNF